MKTRYASGATVAGIHGRIRQVFAIALCASLVGCASVVLPPPAANPEIVQKLRTASLSSARTGDFSLSAGRPARMDTTLGGLRGSSLSPPGGLFSLYLRDEIAAELKAAGLYDEQSPNVIEAQLTDSRLDAAIGTGTARLAAKFVIRRQGATLFDKELSVESSWESSFFGAIALPLAMNQYSALYKALARKLFDDPDFHTALARSSK
jgi:hypothetical protein